MKTPLSKLAISALLFTLALGSVSASPALLQGHKLEFNEDYALATERAKVLEQLIPGTPDYYYYSCLERQSEGDFQATAKLLVLWQERHAGDQRIGLITRRQALLAYDQDPAATYAFLKQELRLGFNHLRSLGDKARHLPTALDPSLLSRDLLVRNAFSRHPESLNGFRDSALNSLANIQLSDVHLRVLLSRMQRPDVPGLAQLVIRDLGNQRSQGFGSLGIHGRLLLTQLEECARSRPELLQDPEFVDAYLRRLRPGDDVNWQVDSSEREAYLNRLQVFVGRLSGAFNSLKAHVLNHRLVHDLAKGQPDAELFLSYLRLPRSATYSNYEYLRKSGQRKYEVDFNQGFSSGLPKVGNDEPLVRAYLSHFFKHAGSYSTYAEYIDDNYLRRLFAEIKILAGEGDMERWYSLLKDPAYYELLKERVEIEFLATQPRYYARDENVKIDVELKNVGTLLIKIFEINSFNYYRDQDREVDASIDLDGLVAGSERTIEFQDAPLRRVQRSFELPELKRAGVYVVELIGNGLSSRAVIHKGRLQLFTRSGSAGHVLRVCDERGTLLDDARVWFSGREYTPDAGGEILIPYGANPGQVRVLLRHGQETALANFQHASETYSLQAGVLVDRESLIEGGSAQVVVRPQLNLNGNAISLEALEDVVLTITSIDHDGVPTTLEVPDFELHGTKESVQQIQVAQGLARLQVELRGTVQSLSSGKPVQLSSARAEFQLNAIDAGLQTESPILGRSDQGYVLDVLGKNGEPKLARRLSIQLNVRGFSDAVSVQLETDANGRIQLGSLPGVYSISVSGFPENRSWGLLTNARTQESRVNGIQGETLRIPYQGAAVLPSRAAFSLIELRSGEFTYDRFDNLGLAGGYLELRGLAAADYELVLLETDQTIRISIGAGTKQGARLVGRDRQLDLAPVQMHISDLGVAGDALIIQLAEAQADAVVHVFATRYLPAYDPFDALFPRASSGVESMWFDKASSSYHSGRGISDEYRYILERRYAQHLPGNMLTRPGLILNPWALEETKSAAAQAGAMGGAFESEKSEAGRGLGRRSAAAAGPVMPGGSPGTFPNIDFLPQAGEMQLNLRADANGVVRVPLAKLGSGALLHVLALDAESRVYRSLALPEKQLVRRDRRLRQGLDPKLHLTQQRSIGFYDTGATVVIEDASNAKLKVYDSLKSVHQLFSTLSANPELAKFDFILNWPELSDEEKREQYSKHACHELHFFLHEKDPAFFAAVVEPYLQNKLHKTFLDHWLLKTDLAQYLDAWSFSQLNIVERILLTRKLSGRTESGQRHLRELLELVQPDPARLAHLFSTALRSGSLEASLGLDRELGEMKERLKKSLPSAAMADAPAAPGLASELDALGYTGADDDDMDADLFASEQQERDAKDDFRGAGERQRREDFARRNQARQLYRAPDPTRPYVENNYWHLTIGQSGPQLIGPNDFWMDYALSNDEQAFASSHFTEASGSFAEMMFALAVLDLPFQPGEQQPESDGMRLSMRAAGPLILVSEEIKAAADAEGALPVLVSQSFFRVDDRYRYDGNQRFDKHVTEEFLIGVPYGAQVVVTNPTSSPRQLELLLQIPMGAIALQRGFKTRGSAMQFQPYATQTVEYLFYFPAPGQFAHYPVHVSREGERIASAEAAKLNVVPKATEIDTTSWEHVSQDGSAEEVLAYLEQANLLRIDLTRIAWRMGESAFFETVISRLRARHRFDPTLWAYGIQHKNADVTREYLSNLPQFLRGCGMYLDSPLVHIDPVIRKQYQQIEFAPLVNPRAQRFGRRREILDLGFASQYESLLGVLSLRPKLDSSDWMTVTYYLLLQDRVAEAQASFARVDAAELHTKIQYDYMSAYMEFFNQEPARARAIAEAYTEYPVERWRRLFQEVLSQLDEAEGKAGRVTNPDDLAQQQAALALSEPSLEARVEAQRVFLEYQNLESCEVNYYEMDIEFLFSTSPFMQQGSGSFAYIRPNKTERISLVSKAREASFDLPQEFKSSNVLVEVRAAGIVRRQAYYANSLTLSSFDNYGQIKLTQSESGKPLAAVYVKVFARDEQGRVRFHKDGYTDLRGRFDYASLTGASDQPAERFAILVLSEEDGAIIREVAPPQR